jgi:hypothetical protein
MQVCPSLVSQCLSGSGQSLFSSGLVRSASHGLLAIASAVERLVGRRQCSPTILYCSACKAYCVTAHNQSTNLQLRDCSAGCSCKKFTFRALSTGLISLVFSFPREGISPAFTEKQITSFIAGDTRFASYAKATGSGMQRK